MTAVGRATMRPEPVEGRASTSAVLSSSKGSARMTGRVRRLGGALALVLAPWGFVIANASYAWMIRNGGSDSSGAEALVLAAEHGGPLADYAAVIDASQNDLWTVWIFPIFIVGNLLGTLLFAIGLLRSRTVPIWPPILIMLWPPLHISGLIIGGEVLEVLGAVLQAIGFAGIAASVLRHPVEDSSVG